MPVADQRRKHAYSASGNASCQGTLRGEIPQPSSSVPFSPGLDFPRKIASFSISLFTDFFHSSGGYCRTNAGHPRENRMLQPPIASDSSRKILAGIALVVLAYGLALYKGWPQKGTDLIVAAEVEQTAPGGHARVPAKLASPSVTPPPLWTITPFGVLLGIIAVFPLLPKVSHWWEHNRNKFLVALSLAVATLAYFFWLHKHPIEGHWPAPHQTMPNASGPNLQAAWTVFADATLGEYVPFIVLLFSLYTISGGIRIEGDLPAHPRTNAIFLAVGSILASFIGTTGAAMVLIRPLLETNRERKHVAHTMIFFIFTVCNCGGCLLPLGDPPLFLGYLLGVPFLYTLSLWKEWLFLNTALILFYYLWDHYWFYPHETAAAIRRDETRVHPLRIGGLWPNVLLLLGVILSVAFLDPSKKIPGTNWHPWLYLREVAQFMLVAASLALGGAHLRQRNRFNYFAIVEVAALFLGIFITMQPALQILSIRGARLGLSAPWHFFWATGGLSSFLDNAPTYVVFFTTAKTLTQQTGLPDAIAGVSLPLLTAISLGAVFMGANTYIGNGPNFMVKTIAEHAGVKMPSFFGYMVYSMCILMPFFIVVTFIFL
jgi:Na+/H+ antiporter NhaD/arsenite permease-like protein